MSQVYSLTAQKFICTERV